MPVKILMRRSISGAHPTLNNKLKDRYNFRARYAEGLNLNFRLNGDPIPPHGIRRFWNEHNYSTHTATCAVCSHGSASCTCKIEVRDGAGNLIEVF